MSFLSTELSALFGSPFELYEFTNGSTTWRYTSGRTARDSMGHTWEPRALKRSAIEENREFSRSAISVSAPRTLPVAVQFIASPPEGVLQLVIYRGHDRDDAHDVVVYWRGRVAAVGFSGSEATLKCDTAYTGIQSSGRRVTYSIPCQRSLYNPGCNANRDLFKVSGSVASFTGSSVTADAFGTHPDGWFAGGEFNVTIGGEVLRRLILDHVGTTVLLMGAPYGLAVSDTFDAFAGCDRSAPVCHGKFDNILNYGGFPWKPLKNPFTGDSVY